MEYVHKADLNSVFGHCGVSKAYYSIFSLRPKKKKKNSR